MIYLALIFIYLGIFTFVTQHTAWTEMLVYPYLQNNGFLLYKDLIAPYTPLFLWFLQGVTEVFGYTPQVSQGLTLTLALINTGLIYLVSTSLWKEKKLGIISAIFYSFWFFYFEGNGLWFELFQTSFIIGSFYYLYSYFFKEEVKKNLLFGSLLLAVSFFIKQSAIWIVPLVILWGVWQSGRIGKTNELKDKVSLAGIFLLPFVILFGLTSLVAYFGGYLKDYLVWSFGYTFLQFPFTPGHSGYPELSQIIKLGIPFVALVPLVIAAFKYKKEAIFSFIFLGTTFMPIFPRWGLFHLQPFLAIFAIIFVPYAWEWLKDRRQQRRGAIFFVALVWVIVVGRQTARFWNMPVRFFEPEVYRLAEEITIKDFSDYFVFNSPDQLYLLTGTVPEVKPYVQNFAWYMEVPGMQGAVVRGLEKEKLRFVIFSPFAEGGGYNIGSYRPKFLADYIDQNYKLKEKLTDSVWVLERINF